MNKKILVFLFVLLCAASLVFAQGAQEGTAKKGESSIEVFSWWTAGGEAEGLQAMIDVFMAKNPGVKFVNATVAGSAGSNAKAVLATRMQGGDPPDSFQVHAGHELIDTWVTVGAMETLDDLFEKNGWYDKYPKGVLDIVSFNGHIYSVPVNIHRSNVLWYNPEIFKKYNLSVPTTLDEMFAVAETLKKHGVTALALGDTASWTATQLLENFILAYGGAEKYNQLWAGKISWSDPDIVKALKDYARMMAYVNPDHSALTDMNALTAVAEGKAAMNLMGDWALGLYQQMGFKQGTDWDWAVFPNTQDGFILISDSFGLPKKVKNKENVIKWLEVCGSQEGQDAFNPIKGSIPARLDADLSKYTDYQKQAMKDFASCAIVPSVAHGSAISEAWVTKVNDIVNVFTTDLDVDAAIKAFQAAADKYAPK